MSASNIPVWVAVLVAVFLLLGSGLTLIGAIGLLRLKSFYERMHAPTLGTTGGLAGIAIASMIYFSALRSSASLHEVLIVIFVVLTAPVTLMLLTRAALYRDRTEANRDAHLRDPADS